GIAGPPALPRRCHPGRPRLRHRHQPAAYGLRRSLPLRHPVCGPVHLAGDSRLMAAPHPALRGHAGRQEHTLVLLCHKTEGSPSCRAHEAPPAKATPTSLTCRSLWLPLPAIDETMGFGACRQDTEKASLFHGFRAPLRGPGMTVLITKEPCIGRIPRL